MAACSWRLHVLGAGIGLKHTTFMTGKADLGLSELDADHLFVTQEIRIKQHLPFCTSGICQIFSILLCHRYTTDMSHVTPNTAKSLYGILQYYEIMQKV
jgi:hypothetical protein